MMDWLIENILFIPFLIGIVFMVTAAVVYCFPPKKINYLYGYRTSASMKSQDRWDFAQRYSSKKMFQSGAALLAVSFIGLVLPLSVNTNFIIGIFLSLPSCLYMFLTTERALRKNFRD
jgi:uncharacterized membrane protein